MTWMTGVDFGMMRVLLSESGGQCPGACARATPAMLATRRTPRTTSRMVRPGGRRPQAVIPPPARQSRSCTDRVGNVSASALWLCGLASGRRVAQHHAITCDDVMGREIAGVHLERGDERSLS